MEKNIKIPGLIRTIIAFICAILMYRKISRLAEDLNEWMKVLKVNKKIFTKRELLKDYILLIKKLLNSEIPRWDSYINELIDNLKTNNSTPKIEYLKYARSKKIQKLFIKVFFKKCFNLEISDDDHPMYNYVKSSHAILEFSIYCSKKKVTSLYDIQCAFNEMREYSGSQNEQKYYGINGYKNIFKNNVIKNILLYVCDIILFHDYKEMLVNDIPDWSNIYVFLKNEINSINSHKNDIIEKKSLKSTLVFLIYYQAIRIMLIELKNNKKCIKLNEEIFITNMRKMIGKN